MEDRPRLSAIRHIGVFYLTMFLLLVEGPLIGTAIFFGILNYGGVTDVLADAHCLFVTSAALAFKTAPLTLGLACCVYLALHGVAMSRITHRRFATYAIVVAYFEVIALVYVTVTGDAGIEAPILMWIGLIVGVGVAWVIGLAWPMRVPPA